MLRRRGVIALWEPKRTSVQFDLDQLFQDAAASVAAAADALVYSSSLAMTLDEIKPATHIRARFMTLRSKDSSPVWYDPQSGLTPITIPPGSYIADVMHLIIKPAGCHGSTDGSGCIVFDRHDNGPTLGELATYLNDHLKIPINLVSLYNRNLQKDLEDIDGRLRRIDVGFHVNKAHAVPEDGLIGNLTAIVFGERIPSVGFALGVGRARRDTYLPDNTQAEAMRIVGEAGEYVERMKLAGRRKSNGNVEEINILRQRIGQHLDFAVDPAAPTMPNHDDAYRKLEGMYADFFARGVIETSVSARLLVR
jgi:hypothetical protein